ncbi:LacI family transcriptional regulator [Serinibacter arcticus]|uniref:LacI family transcriptional regulator n=1 Tax=Serinibacter arcticus TaxID=1655435 RepID=A0A2U1ZZL2_9MICO|nr:LacI family transcriptional regulator [Serinibacter arcticus]
MKDGDGPATPRLTDVAVLAGVSIATASRALSGTGTVSEGLTRRVMQAADELRYVVNPHARSLAGGFSSVIGLMVYEIDDPYFGEIAGGVIQVAAEHGWSVQVSHQDREAASDLAGVRLLRSQRVGAIVIAGSGYRDPTKNATVNRELEAFAASGGRLVAIGHRDIDCHSVLPDNVGATRAAAEHLIALGHRRLGVVSGPDSLTTVADRRTGIELAAAAADGVDVAWEHAAFTRDGGRLAAARLLDAHPDLTAIIALNDTMAIGALSVLRDRGIDVPGAVSVTGIDDIQVAQDLAPALTTVRLPMAAMGRQAALLALQPPAGGPTFVEVGLELVVRSSTAPPPA